MFSYFPFGFEGRIWDLIVSVPDHCLSFYFVTETITYYYLQSSKGHNSKNAYPRVMVLAICTSSKVGFYVDILNGFQVTELQSG